MKLLRPLSPALVVFALACDADPVRPPTVAAGPQLATVAADACTVDGDLTVRRIDPPGATTSRAVAVNNLGEVLVVAEPGGAFLWSPASGFQRVPIEFPSSVNDRSQVVGTNGAYATAVPVVWSQSAGLQPLALPAGYTAGVARDINAVGDVAGGIRAADYGLLPVRWVAGVPELLSIEEVTYFYSIGGAVALNDGGDVIGLVWPESYVYTLLWPSDGSPPVHAGGLGYDINNARQVVSTAYDEVSADARAYLYTPGADSELQIAPERGFATTAVALNDAAVVVGERYPVDVTPTGPRRAYRWTSSEGLALLPLLAGTDSSTAVDVNEAETIVGRSGSVAVLWAPTSTPAAALSALADQVRTLSAGGVMAQTDAAPLLAKLTNAGRLLAADRLAAARGLVDAFANQVRALERAGRIDAATAASLLGAVSCLTSSL